MHKRIWIVLAILSSGIFFQSCTEDVGLENDDLTGEVNIIEEFPNSLAQLRGGRPGGGGGGGGGGNGGGNQGGGTDVDDMNYDLLNSWTKLFYELDRYAGGMRPNATARAIAYVYLTAYETAAPGMRGFSSNSQRLNGLDVDQPNRRDDIQFELALNSAMAMALSHFLFTLDTDKRSQIEELRIQNEAFLSQTLSQEEIEESKEWGRDVAAEVIRYSQTDDEAEEQILEPQPLSYEPPTGDGYWTYSAEPERALFPYWKSVRTFVIGPDETSTVPPIEYSNVPGTPYFDQMQEVYDSNNAAKAAQGEQLHIAEFWSDDVEGLMMSPPMRQVSILNQLIEERDLDLDEALAIHLKLGFSLNDAAVSTWADKYEYMVMRPSNFIHEFIDPAFQTNLFRLVFWPNPSFPGYPSGHSCFASAAAGVFIDAFGNQVTFTDRTHEGRTEFQGEPRTFTSMREMADENGYSRVPLGVHIEIDCTEGLRLGYEISDAVNELDLGRPNT